MHDDFVPPPRLLCTKEAARFVSLSSRTLEKHRRYGTGPAYLKLGGRVVYRSTDLQLWAAQGLRTSTRQITASAVHPAQAKFRQDLTS